MDNDMDNTNNIDEDAAFPSRPLGFWLRAVDRLLEREFQAAFAAEGVTRRDWRILTLIDGDVEAPEALERLRGKKLRTLADRGWVTRVDAGWALTDEGRAAKERLGALVDGIRSKVAATVSDDDFATTVASLEAIARGLGWDGAERLPGGHGFGRREGFGPGRGFGAGPGFGAGRGFGPGGRGHHGHHGHGDCGHGGRGFGGDFAHGGHGHHGHAGHRMAEDAYARGFEAGFTRGESRRDA
ncbi:MULTISPECIES: MarR family winged helix-turn-helix transcriptional regulator [Microbacterium]|uniref:DNA-binding transcriptional regulator, MarR family n=1 Tax=Microbacterium saccharophilum TaxID=1213358 RepID=A0A7Z7CXU4_9MICO|nr:MULTISPECIES: hypothetical protein [Microbacterium]SFI50169.1 DNA-binding transcriptional regulator, MarR family [Microbacterium saccharophilum]